MECKDDYKKHECKDDECQVECKDDECQVECKDDECQVECKDDECQDECKDDDYKCVDHTHREHFTSKPCETDFLKLSESARKLQIKTGYSSTVLIESARYANYPYVSTPVGSPHSGKWEHLKRNYTSPHTDLGPGTSKTSTESSDDSSENNADSRSFKASTPYRKLNVTQQLRKNLERNDSSSDSEFQTSPATSLREKSSTKFNSVITQPSSLPSKKLKKPINVLGNHPQTRWYPYSRRKRDSTLKTLDTNKDYVCEKDNQESLSDSGCSSDSSRTLTRKSLSSSSSFTLTSACTSTISVEGVETSVEETEFVDSETNTTRIVEDKTPDEPVIDLAEDFKDMRSGGNQNVVSLNIEDGVAYYRVNLNDHAQEVDTVEDEPVQSRQLFSKTESSHTNN